ncbi:P-type conjugative transfer protein TrbL [uncultured Sphingomonas sp.]|uniref:P-type conjugative transfer protein TrbL n=1 Tax=uncultured Sphingomonas sp. TaxID=158754 RepID=UPI00263639A6|nr:P-type conjugative transfer protein TrbL [uncultured Sphingomonas sp.]
MDDLSVIDRFMQAFTSYIDSGFGLLGGDVHFLSATLIGIDVTLAGLFWALGGEQDVIGRFIKKILYVGAFAFILNSFSTLADIIFRSFAAAGLTAGGGTLAADDLLKPGTLASTGFSAAWPLLQQMSQLLGFTTFFDNFVTIAVLLFAWVIVILAFFVLAIQLFVTIIEFKLTTLAGFVLVPFALWNRTSFLAERVLGNVVSSGIKVMVLAVIVGIGSTFFTEFVGSLQGQEPDIVKALSLTLAALTLLGLGIFGPGIASGLVSGAPQLGAGAAVGTAVGSAGVVALGGATVAGAAGAIGGGAFSAVRAGTAMGSAASTAYKMGQEGAGSTSVGAGLGGVARATGNALRARANNTLGISEAAASGRQAAFAALTSRARPSATASTTTGEQEQPAWARSLKQQQDARHHRQIVAHTLREGDRGGASATPDIKEKED